MENRFDQPLREKFGDELGGYLAELTNKKEKELKAKALSFHRKLNRQIANGLDRIANKKIPIFILYKYKNRATGNQERGVNIKVAIHHTKQFDPFSDSVLARVARIKTTLPSKEVVEMLLGLQKLDDDGVEYRVDILAIKPCKLVKPIAFIECRGLFEAKRPKDQESHLCNSNIIRIINERFLS